MPRSRGRPAAPQRSRHIRGDDQRAACRGSRGPRTRGGRPDNRHRPVRGRCARGAHDAVRHAAAPAADGRPRRRAMRQEGPPWPAAAPRQPARTLLQKSAIHVAILSLASPASRRCVGRRTRPREPRGTAPRRRCPAPARAAPRPSGRRAAGMPAMCVAWDSAEYGVGGRRGIRGHGQGVRFRVRREADCPSSLRRRFPPEGAAHGRRFRGPAVPAGGVPARPGLLSR